MLKLNDLTNKEELMEDYLKFSLVCICIGLIIFTVAWYYMCPVFILIGLLLVIAYMLIPISQKIMGNEDDLFIPFSGCMVMFGIIIFMGVCALFINDGKKYYVSGLCDIRHQFSDCKYRETINKDYEVSKFSAILMGCISDCEPCKKRVREDYNSRKEEWMRKKQQSDIEDIQKKIEILQDVLSRVKEGEDIDVSDYDFLKDIEDEIREEVREELESGWEY